MAKKHWIYIKRGLSEDPKHRAAMGECVWLFMHIIDRADWETGIAYNWKDKEEAADMSLPVDTLRRQRQKLAELEYIRCDQKQHAQDIAIYEWRNPRDYGAEVKNPRIEGSHELPPSAVQGDNQGSNQGLNQGSNQVQAQIKTPTLDSKSKSVSKSEGASAKPKAGDFPSNVLFREVTEKYPKKANWHDVLKLVHGIEQRLGHFPTKDELVPYYSAWTGNGWNEWSIHWLEYAVKGELPNRNSNGHKPQEPKAFDAIRRFMARGESNG